MFKVTVEKKFKASYVVVDDELDRAQDSSLNLEQGLMAEDWSIEITRKFEPVVEPEEAPFDESEPEDWDDEPVDYSADVELTPFLGSVVA